MKILLYPTLILQYLFITNYFNDFSFCVNINFSFARCADINLDVWLNHGKIIGMEQTYL